MEEQSLSLPTLLSESPPSIADISAYPDLVLPSCDKQLPPPYQSTTVSPKYAFETNYIKANAGESPTVKFTVTSKPPLSPDTQHSLTHYDGSIATRRFEVLHDAIEFHEVRVSDTGFYTIRCTNAAGLEGEKTIELEVFKKKFSALFKKAAAIKRVSTTNESMAADSADTQIQFSNEMPIQSSVEVPEYSLAVEILENPSSRNNHEFFRDNAAVHQSNDQEALVDLQIEPTRTLPMIQAEVEIIIEPLEETVETTVEEEMGEPATESLGCPEEESIEEQDAAIKYKEFMHLLLPFKFLGFIILWSIPCFVGIFRYLRKAIRDSETGMKQRAQINFRIAQGLLGAWIICSVLGIVIIILVILATVL